MSTTYSDQTAPLGLRSRLWRTFRAFGARRRLFAPESNRYLSRRLRREATARPPTMQPGVGTVTSTTTTTDPATSTTLYADASKVNPVEWFPFYQGCVEHFVNVAQYRPLAQSLAAHINILLPYQRATEVVLEFSESTANQHQSEYNSTEQQHSSSRAASRLISLTPYIRRLVITATDAPAVMQELFGDNWVKGIGTIHSQERLNYLFSAKSGGWLKTKAQYDLSPYETVPFLRPLRDPQEEELRAAEAHWSEWLAMEDWMVGPRSPFDGLPGN